MGPPSYISVVRKLFNAFIYISTCIENYGSIDIYNYIKILKLYISRN